MDPGAQQHQRGLWDTDPVMFTAPCSVVLQSVTVETDCGRRRGYTSSRQDCITTDLHQKGPWSGHHPERRLVERSLVTFQTQPYNSSGHYPADHLMALM
ncbi:hypothetical protein DPEC_G00031510 [Dallia pectoralis]|uniref:Uncharacterized protein n=1 Tax=Dallia pectoralis TaxID=75939 RepID=A0ACC2HCZ2_DALPE|nr:hypothetical protein DPEC_G00031510 [Dallia pectoralis]